jgi:hypothetical protein
MAGQWGVTSAIERDGLTLVFAVEAGLAGCTHMVDLSISVGSHTLVKSTCL